EMHPVKQTRPWVRLDTSVLAAGGLALSAFGLAGGIARAAPAPAPRRPAGFSASSRTTSTTSPAPSRPRLGQGDMPLEAKRFRDVRIAIAELRVIRGVAVTPRQQCPQPQQRNLEQYESRVGRLRCQPIDRGLRLLDVGARAALQQRFHQDPDGLAKGKRIPG